MASVWDCWRKLVWTGTQKWEACSRPSEIPSQRRRCQTLQSSELKSTHPDEAVKLTCRQDGLAKVDNLDQCEPDKPKRSRTHKSSLDNKKTLSTETAHANLLLLPFLEMINAVMALAEKHLTYVFPSRLVGYGLMSLEWGLSWLSRGSAGREGFLGASWGCWGSVLQTGRQLVEIVLKQGGNMLQEDLSTHHTTQSISQRLLQFIMCSNAGWHGLSMSNWTSGVQSSLMSAAIQSRRLQGTTIYLTKELRGGGEMTLFHRIYHLQFH